LAPARWLSKASIRFAVWVDAEQDPNDLAPVGTFRIRIAHAQLIGCSSS
jgi:hypothetical protein